MLLNTILLLSGGVVQALQLLAALSILILLHEGGHFLFARLFKTRVEKFYLFFDFLFPFSGLLNFSIFKKKVGDTEYGIGWFPLGGYVKISGMVDESMDKEQMAQPPQPWEYRSKPAWQRLFIMLGGIIMNVLVGMVIYMFIFGVWGETYLPTKNLKWGVAVDSVAQSIGLRSGDMIVAVDNKPIDRFNKIPVNIIFSSSHGTIQINRNGKDTSINIPQGTIRKILKSERGSFVQPRIPAVVDSVIPNSFAARAGLLHMDSIVAINGAPIYFFDEFQNAKKENYGKSMTIHVIRNNQPIEVTVTLPKDSMLGFTQATTYRYMQDTTITYNFGGAIKRGFFYTFEQFEFYWQQFQLILTSKEVSPNESLGGIVSFGKLFEPVFNWQHFLSLTAFISIILAFMNLLPIPGLDGGYVIFLIYELISRRKVSEKVMERATTVGLVLLLALMLYANGLDIFRMFKK